MFSPDRFIILERLRKLMLHQKAVSRGWRERKKMTFNLHISKYAGEKETWRGREREKQRERERVQKRGKQKKTDRRKERDREGENDKVAQKKKKKKNNV